MKKLVILASGEGTTFEAVCEAVKSGKVEMEITGLITNNPQAGVIKKAQKNQVPWTCLPFKNFPSFQEWDQALLESIKKYHPDLIFLLGFLLKVGPQVLRAFPHKILNIHPSLLPRHGGPGMYGIHVHKAVLASKDAKTGVSIHEVTEDYDSGPVLAQRSIDVLEGDTPESLEKRVKKEEKEFLIEFLKKINKDT